MIVIQIEVKEVSPGNVGMQARGGHFSGVATDDEVKVADQIMAGLDSLFRTVGKYTEVRPLTIITKPGKRDDTPTPPAE